MQQWTNDYYYEHKDDYRQKCMDAGMTINTEVDRDAIKDALIPVIQSYLEDQGAGLWDMYQKICEMSDANVK